MTCHTTPGNPDEASTRSHYDKLKDAGLKIEEMALLMKVSVETLQKYIDEWEEDDRQWREREL